MKLRLSPFKFVDLLLLTLTAVIFIFIPFTPDNSNPQVKSAVSPILIPLLKTGGVPVPKLTANGIYIFDPDSGTVLYQKNSTQRFYPASTTKLMTALVSLSVYNLDQVLTVKTGGNALGSSIHLANGDKLTVENLLYGLLVDSGNDAAVTLAENYPNGGYTGFIALMNQKAGDLGLTATHFTNVTGLYNPNHYTSAQDLTTIARAAIANETIRKIVSTKKITFTDITGRKKFSVVSTNLLLGINGVIGLKTGWTPESGECLVTLVTRDGKSVIITLLSSKDRFGESTKLINWVYANFNWETI